MELNSCGISTARIGVPLWHKANGPLCLEENDQSQRRGGAQYLVENKEDRSGEDEIEVKSCIANDQWDKNKLMQFIVEEMTEYIMSKFL
ncbi:hypothetical protein H5410_003231 [Solanum commersonii]|uniref:Uncharacterized protein n=1 Tax=Solanum commersonii TaxID=4109 RepID=A0A9J6B4I9_SOLCO|nr:hypothetical protein H5410_003231 [Solanum commersonii]